jgi:hypothetical protein
MEKEKILIIIQLLNYLSVLENRRVVVVESVVSMYLASRGTSSTARHAADDQVPRDAVFCRMARYPFSPP